jgi:hypothetical protein
MSDFLARLAGRALGTVPVAQPLISSTFAPVPEQEGIGAVSEFKEAPVGIEGDKVAPRAAPEEPPVRMQSRITLPRSDRPSSRLEQLVNVGEIQNVEAAGTAQSVPRAPKPAPRAAGLAATTDRKAAPANTVPDSHSQGEQARETVPSRGDAVSRTIVNTVPAARYSNDKAARAAPSNVSKPPAPIIRVTIGRVDVRAEFPARATPAAPRKVEAPSLSLEDYLKQRKEGKR